MNVCKTKFLLTGFLFVVAACASAGETADVDKKSAAKLQHATLARGTVTFSLPAVWKAQTLRSRILEREYAVPAAQGDKIAGRLTMMRSGGSVKENVDRWIDQFTQPDGKPTVDRAKVREKKINGQEVTIVDISGTFKDRQGGGPFAPGRVVQRPGYRMLGAIAQTKRQGQYFFKLYGPEKTMLEAEKRFMAMIETVTSR